MTEIKAIGFKTKTIREAESNGTASEKHEVQEEETMDVTPLQFETIQRIQGINAFICGEDFPNLKEEEKQRILLDLSYYSKVSTFI